MKKLVLRFDSIFLGLAGIFGIAADLLSHFSGSGPFGMHFYKNPIVITGVEAHAFAVMTAGLLWYFSTVKNWAAGNWFGIIAHLICGVSNILWFDIFRSVNAATQGVIDTTVHFIFVILNAIVIFKQSRNLEPHRAVSKI